LRPHRYLRAVSDTLVTDKPFAVTVETTKTPTVVTNWANDTEAIDIGGTVDAGWFQKDVSASGTEFTATGGNISHLIQAREGSLDGTYDDIYTLSFDCWAGDTDRLRAFLQADVQLHGGSCDILFSTPAITAGAAVASGSVVGTQLDDLGGGKYRAHITVDMSAVTSATPMLITFQLLTTGGADVFAPSGTPESAHVDKVQVNGGGIELYVPNTASAGESHGFTIGAADDNAQAHTLDEDLIINFEPVAAGQARRFEIILTQGNPAGWDTVVHFDNSAANVTAAVDKPALSSQGVGKKTLLAVRVTDTELTAWWQELN
jgi:hypothetical protein